MFIFVPFIIIAFVYVGIRMYKKKKPALYFEYECKEDEIVFKDNLIASKAVCDGLYVPFGVKLEKKDYIKVLEKMGELYESDNTLKEDMKKLAEESVKQII